MKSFMFEDCVSSIGRSKFAGSANLYCIFARTSLPMPPGTRYALQGSLRARKYTLLFHTFTQCRKACGRFFFCMTMRSPFAHCDTKTVVWQILDAALGKPVAHVWLDTSVRMFCSGRFDPPRSTARVPGSELRNGGWW